MPPTVEDRLRDIREAIVQIEQLTGGMDLEQFTSNLVSRLATERLLEIVCEASRHIPDDDKKAALTIHWRKMIDFGNLLRHAYHSTDVNIVWDVICNELPALKSFVDSRLSALR